MSVSNFSKIHNQVKEILASNIDVTKFQILFEIESNHSRLNLSEEELEALVDVVDDKSCDTEWSIADLTQMCINFAKDRNMTFVELKMFLEEDDENDEELENFFVDNFTSENYNEN